MEKINLILFPLLAAIIVHLIFSYSAWEINPLYWNENTRNISAFTMFVFVFASFNIAITNINKH